MPFEAVPTVPSATYAKQTMASICYKRADARKNGTRPNPKLTVTIPSSMTENFKPKAGATFGFLLGTGKDAGKAQIAPMVGGCKASQMKGTVRFRFGFVPMLGLSAADSEHINCRPLPNNSFQIDLPAWFRAEEAESADEETEE